MRSPSSEANEPSLVTVSSITRRSSRAEARRLAGSGWARRCPKRTDKSAHLPAPEKRVLLVRSGRPRRRIVDSATEDCRLPHLAGTRGPRARAADCRILAARFAVFDVGEFVRLLREGNPRFNHKSTSSLVPLIVKLRQNGLRAELPFVRQFLQQTSDSKKQKYRLAIAYLTAASMALEQQHEQLKRPVASRDRPANFTWLIPGRIGGMSLFRNNESPLASTWWLYENGVRHVISIEHTGHEITKRCVAQVGQSMTWSAEFMLDYTAPPVEQLLRFCETVDLAEMKGAVAVHCWGGTGRTGCFLAAYLIYLSYLDNNVIGSRDAIAYARSHYQRKSVETSEQRLALESFAQYLRKLRNHR